ncbi:hypothetical protein M5K25_014310 [Dendrobium thyrsiflorum]|uniref:Uncharacterized protein n=1 Tax=Dendrobium thyrsiflorum TaxID=117978 RepID=A0ABD0UVB3_DENTH
MDELLSHYRAFQLQQIIQQTSIKPHNHAADSMNQTRVKELRCIYPPLSLEGSLAGLLNLAGSHHSAAIPIHLAHQGFFVCIESDHLWHLLSCGNGEKLSEGQELCKEKAEAEKTPNRDKKEINSDAMRKDEKDVKPEGNSNEDIAKAVNMKEYMYFLEQITGQQLSKRPLSGDGGRKDCSLAMEVEKTVVSGRQRSKRLLSSDGGRKTIVSGRQRSERPLSMSDIG